ncbi:hypothetical protein [Paraburkholderia ferrariae]|uniref:Uncharacterized protein n=1 Tax=Paraburkholderia ferrariae TaxID=386056 RepID=A0ABU9RYS7_9BURK
MTKRIELAHNPDFADLLDIKRDLYTLGGSIPFDEEAIAGCSNMILSGEIGFLSISSPMARTEICTWRGEHTIIWDSRWLEFVNALCRLSMPFIVTGGAYWDSATAPQDVVTLFLIEQLSILGETEVGLALTLKRQLVSRGRTAADILAPEPYLPDAQFRRRYKELARFTADSLQHLTLIHEWLHLGFRLGVNLRDTVIEQLRPSLEDFVDTVRRAGEKFLARLEGEERAREALILDDMCARLIRDGASDISAEEIYCDVHAASRYARGYVAPRVIRHNDAALFRHGFWVIQNYLAAFYLFDQIAFFAATVVSRKGWNDVAFSGPARARDGMTKHVYRSAAENVARQCSFSSASDIQADFTKIDGWFARYRIETLKWLRAFAFDPRWSDWRASALAQVAGAGGIAAARADVWRYLGWPA